LGNVGVVNIGAGQFAFPASKSRKKERTLLTKIGIFVTAFLAWLPATDGIRSRDITSACGVVAQHGVTPIWGRSNQVKLNTLF